MDSMLELLPHHATVCVVGASALAGLIYDGKLGWLPPKTDPIVGEISNVAIDVNYPPSPVLSVTIYKTSSMPRISATFQEDSPCSPYPACVRNLLEDSTTPLFLLILVLMLLGFLTFWLLRESRTSQAAVSGPDLAPDRLVKALLQEVKNLHKELQEAEERGTAAQRQNEEKRENAAILTYLTTSELARSVEQASRNAARVDSLRAAAERKLQKQRCDSSGTISRLRSHLRELKADLEKEQETVANLRAQDATRMHRLTRTISDEARKQAEILTESGRYRSEAERLRERVVNLEGQIQELSRRDVRDSVAQTEVDVVRMGSETHAATGTVDAGVQTIAQIANAGSETANAPVPVHTGLQTILHATSSGSQTNAFSEAVEAETCLEAPATPSITPEVIDSTVPNEAAEPSPEELQRRELERRIEGLNKQLDSRVKTWVPHDQLEAEIERLERLVQAQEITTCLSRIETEQVNLQARLHQREESLALTRAGGGEAEQPDNGPIDVEAALLQTAAETQNGGFPEHHPSSNAQTTIDTDPTGNAAIGTLPNGTPFFATTIPRLDGRRKIYTSAPKVNLRRWARNQDRDLWDFILGQGYYLGDFDPNFAIPEAFQGPSRRPAGEQSRAGSVRFGSAGASAGPRFLGPESGRTFDVNATAFVPANVIRLLPQQAEQGRGEEDIPLGSHIPPLDLALFNQWSPRNIRVGFLSPQFVRGSSEPFRRHSEPRGGEAPSLLFVAEEEELVAEEEELVAEEEELVAKEEEESAPNGENPIDDPEVEAANLSPPGPECGKTTDTDGASTSDNDKNNNNDETAPQPFPHDRDFSSPQPRPRRRGGRHATSRGQSLASKQRKYGPKTILSAQELQRQITIQDHAIRHSDENGPTGALPERFSNVTASPPRVVLPRVVALRAQSQELPGLFHTPAPSGRREWAGREWPVREQGLMESRYAPDTDEEVAAVVGSNPQALVQQRTETAASEASVSAGSARAGRMGSGLRASMWAD